MYTLTIIVFRSDRGEEYVNKELKDIFRKEGIKNQYTISYTPEQNRIVERKNRMFLVKIAKYILIDAGLEKYWDEAMHGNLQNRLTTEVTSITLKKKRYSMDSDLRDNWTTKLNNTNFQISMRIIKDIIF
ncbi:hypothetical protein HZH66_010529 [Vespula vulgaris]|uniref:Integrase catalytic domain-containing protein n=1 Tax=Vespula vulgaris TaxID=7454 RepID=A0A834JIH8_VESVU|nr:hypothetical protein HZH66_010529 [Vespula vulgaris]